ncbi:MAG: adenine nucleotide alpha hydrolase [Bacteroidales bacterium]|nr:adenine nucleotide alpha hydrolase [Bacteroidales bacterium]
MKQKAILHWSGGKDAALCLNRIKNNSDFEIAKLVTTLSLPFHRISMHGVRESLLDAQAINIGLPLEKLFLPENPSMEIYEKAFTAMLINNRKEGLEQHVFGDIFLEDIKTYRENLFVPLSLTPVFPLWKNPSLDLAYEFIDHGFKAIVVCVDDRKMRMEFAGCEFNRDFLKSLPNGIDPCGENGEFHTFVYDGPVFQMPVNFMKGETTLKEYKNQHTGEIFGRFWFCDLINE